MGDVKYVLKTIETNIKSTGAIMAKVATDVDNGLKTLLDHKYKLTMSLSRCRLVTCNDTKDKFARQEDNIYLSDQLRAIDEAITGLLKVKGLLTARPAGCEGAPPSEKDYKHAQADEKVTESELPSASTGKDSPIAPAEPVLPWWDKDDESTWIPYGWVPKRPDLWVDFNFEHQPLEVALPPMNGGGKPAKREVDIEALNTELEKIKTQLELAKQGK